MSDLALLKHLYKDDELEKLIAITKNSDEINHRLFYIHALRKLGEYHIALSYISEHQMELYNAFGPELIKLHIDSLAEISDYDQALNVLKQYESFPYFSLETNEVIAKLSDMVQTKRKHEHINKKYDLLVLEKYLASNDENQALIALTYIRENYSDSYIHLLQKFMLDGSREIIRSFILLLLVEQKYDDVVKIKKFDVIHKVVPSKVVDPFARKSFSEIDAELSKLIAADDDLSLGNVVRNIFSHHTIYIFPAQVHKNDRKLISYLYLFVAYNMMGRTTSLENFELDFKLDQGALTTLISKYEFTSFPLYQIHIKTTP